MRFIMKIQIHSPETESDSESSVSASASVSVSESTSEELFAHLEEELGAVEPILKEIEGHLEAFEKRVKQPPINSFIPATEPVLVWCKKKGLGSKPFSLEEWFQAVLTDVVSTDLETRTLKFGFAGLPWGKREISVFDLLRSVPTYLNNA